MRVVLDTNIYISAILFGGDCEAILKILESSGSKILISDFIINEIETVLRKKFKWTKEEIETVILNIQNKTSFINTSSKIDIINENKFDNEILECAVDGRADIIISGDTKHIQPLGKVGGILILSPRKFLNLI
jgi:uncharacterized protein